MPSDAYRRLCHTGSTTVHCQMTRDSIANRCQYAPHHKQMFWCRVVASAFCPPGVACDDCPAWRSSHLNSRLPESRCLWTSIFVFSIFRGCHFNNVSSIFVTGFDKSRPIVFPLSTAICKQSPVYCPRCSERHTASVTLRILCFKKYLHFIQ